MVTITNAGPQALRNVAVKIPVPPGTKFVDARHKNPNWYGGNPLVDAKDQLETVMLLSPEAFGPGEVFAFELILQVQPQWLVRVLGLDLKNSRQTPFWADRFGWNFPGFR